MDGEQKSKRAGRRGELYALDQHLLDKPGAGRAERHAQCHLSGAGGGARDRQVRHVRTGHQQEERADQREDRKGTAELAPEQRVAAGGHVADSEGRIGDLAELVAVQTERRIDTETVAKEVRGHGLEGFAQLRG
jgi:hypothetical protein